MHRILLLLLGVLASAHSRAEAAPPETLTPRYTPVIGVRLPSPTWTLILRRVECMDSDGIKQVYVWPRKDPVFLAVQGAVHGYPARDAGLGCADVIDSVDGSRVTEISDMHQALRRAEGLTLIEYRRPERLFFDPDGITHVLSWIRRLVLLETRPLDRVAEILRQKPSGRMQKISYSDRFGPHIDIQVSSSFSEETPDRLRYACSIGYYGGDDVLHIESLAFPLLGAPFELPTIRRGSAIEIVHESDVTKDGIPTLVEIPITLARRILHDKTSDFFDQKKYRGSVGRIGTGRSDDWYAWERTNAECYLPEAFAHRLKRILERHRLLGNR